MQIAVIPDDGMVGINGEFRRIPGLRGLSPQPIHAFQWRDGVGEIEFNDGSSNALIFDLSPFQAEIDAWNALTPAPLTDEELLGEAKRSRTTLINTSCATTITAGFASNALGSVHRYTATLEDQANLLGLVVIGADGEFTCTNAVGVKARRLHTLAELKMVLADGGAFKDQCLARARLLKDQIEVIQPSVTAVADVNAIEWTLE